MPPFVSPPCRTLFPPLQFNNRVAQCHPPPPHLLPSLLVGWALGSWGWAEWHGCRRREHAGSGTGMVMGDLEAYAMLLVRRWYIWQVVGRWLRTVGTCWLLHGSPAAAPPPPHSHLPPRDRTGAQQAGMGKVWHVCGVAYRRQKKGR